MKPLVLATGELTINLMISSIWSSSSYLPSLKVVRISYSNSVIHLNILGRLGFSGSLTSSSPSWTSSSRTIGLPSSSTSADVGGYSSASFFSSSPLLAASSSPFASFSSSALASAANLSSSALASSSAAFSAAAASASAATLSSSSSLSVGSGGFSSISLTFAKMVSSQRSGLMRTRSSF